MTIIMRCFQLLFLLVAIPIFAQEKCEPLPPLADIECPHEEVGQRDALKVAKCWHIYRSDQQSANRASLCRVGLDLADLSGVDLRSANLIAASLWRTNLSNASLEWANFTGANLNEANLKNAVLVQTNLSGASLKDANLREALLVQTNLSKVDLWGADLRGALLRKANLSEAFLMNTNLSGADLSEANLSDTNLTDTNLTAVDLSEAKLFRAVYEPSPGKEPTVDAISEAFGLETLRYEHPRALVTLRKMFKDAGYREQERQVTRALKQGEISDPYGELTLTSAALIQYVAFELTTEWGLKPERALVILLSMIPIFAVPYAIALWTPKSGMLWRFWLRKRNGIWRAWSDSRVRRDLGCNNPELIRAGGLEAIQLGLYFSVLSAFHIGWRDLNVGNWISRMQPQEYTLQASGWIRTVSGIQSLLSVYLLALWVLTYFGRPFE